jgi:fluoride exporter
MERLLWICLGGAVGTGARYLVSVWAARTLGLGFPWGTLIVNVVGCFLLGAVMHLALHSASMSPTLRLTLTSGFLGGLTTYSSFNYETTKLFQDGMTMVAVANFGATLAGCFAAGVLGLVAARALVGG